jgi:hypothetical protein
MAETQPAPGTRGRLIREGLQRHPQLSAEDLAALLTEQNALGIEFQAEEVRKARALLGDQNQQTPPETHHQPLFTDHIPPVREHPQIQETPPKR